MPDPCISAASTKTKILCVDDQPANLLSLHAVLGSADYEVIEARSGPEALICVQSEDFAAILLDVQMPILDGFETAKLIRQNERSKNTPIIFLTANYPSEVYAIRGYEAGAVDYLFKPLNIEVLRAKVSVFVDLFRARQEIKQQAERLREIEMREKEREIQEFKRISAHRYHNLVEGIRDGIVWSMNPETFRFKYVSPQVQQVTGYTLEQWLADEQLWKCLPPDARSRVGQLLEEARAGNGRMALEHPIIKADGNLAWFRTDVHMDQDPETGEHELSGISMDITHLKESVRALKAAVKVRDEFLSVASHELKTPITPLQLQMQGFVRMIENGNLESVPADDLKCMVEISDAQVGRLVRLIDQILDVSRLSDGRFHLRPEEANLSEIVQSVLNQLKHELEASECILSVELQQDVWGVWDKLRIEQILINLLTNAMKYAGGMPVNVELAAEDGMARLRVKDQGIGIKEEDQRRIFERFERAVSSRNYGGLGLGLYIVSQIVKLHEGTIEVESELGKGATFAVNLPLNSRPH